MSEYKYIMYEVKHTELTTHIPIIFPANLVHADVDKFMRICVARTFPKADVKPITAGMINNLSIDSVYGDSETMRLKSKKDDADTIDTMPYLHGIK